jgi:hypothetical protein
LLGGALCLVCDEKGRRAIHDHAFATMFDGHAVIEALRIFAGENRRRR